MISIVVPAYNEEEGLSELYRRIAASAQAWGEDFELILVDDGSRDRTLAIATDLAQADRRVKVVSFSRNFGHQAAVSAGLAHSKGNIVAVMDADLQDPPEELHQFITKIREGYDVVYAVRTKRKEGPFKRLAYYLYYRLLARLATLDIPLDAGDFCVMSGAVVDAINALPERNRFVRGLRTWVGYRQTGLAYERAARFAGDSKYPFSKLLKLAADGIINFSYRPLQLISLLGFFTAALAVVLGLIVLVLYIGDHTILGFNPRQARGWTSLALLLLFSSSVQLVGMGILGEYIGRIFEETKARPIYVVGRRINIDAPASGR
jgi:polyisoprenyl-phosphate glycosyltransferase